MESVKTLIDKAAKICGSDEALALRLGTARPNVSLMRSGKRAVSPATAAELAEIAGEDAREAAIAAVLEGAKGTRREGVLREILGKGLAAGVAGMSLIFYSGEGSAAWKNDASASGRIDHCIHRIKRAWELVLLRITACVPHWLYASDCLSGDAEEYGQLGAYRAGAALWPR